VPHLPVDIQQIDADFYAWTGHKALGPTGIGVLRGHRELLQDMAPFLSGGDMISTVGLQASTWNALPWKYEAGTSMIAEAIGLGAAIDYLASLGMSQGRNHELALTRQALGRLAEVPGLTVLGPARVADRAGVISFTIDGAHPHDVAEVLNRTNVCVRAGHHCAQPLMRHLGLSATIPIVSAVSSVVPVPYAEMVVSIASRSAGPGTRASIDEFTVTTSRAIETVGGAGRGKAILVLSPDEPPMIMRATVFCAIPAGCDDAVAASIAGMVQRVQDYVPGYTLRADPQFDGPRDSWHGLARVAVFLQVRGNGDYLPPYAGNLDIITASSARVGDLIAQARAAVTAGANP